MKIAILGAGNVGGALGQSWASSGQEIIFGVPRPGEEKAQSLVKKMGGKASAKGWQKRPSSVKSSY
jgi:predicted dinucleotide-binding enzyme